LILGFRASIRLRGMRLANLFSGQLELSRDSA